MFCHTLCPFWFCNHLDGEERAGCLFVFLVPRDCCVALPHVVTGLSAVYDCGISQSYPLTILQLAAWFNKGLHIRSLVFNVAVRN